MTGAGAALGAAEHFGGQFANPNDGVTNTASEQHNIQRRIHPPRSTSKRPTYAGTVYAKPAYVKRAYTSVGLAQSHPGPMPKSLFTPAYKSVVAVLFEARTRAGVGQVELAARLGKAQSFVSRVETGERRVDVVEFCAIARAIGADPYALLAEAVGRFPEDLRI